MDDPSQKAANKDDDPLGRWRVRASDSVTLGSPGAAALVGFEKPKCLLAVPFSSLAYAVLKEQVPHHGEPTEELKLAFGSHIVTVWGLRLNELLRAIADRTVVLVRPAPPSAALCEDKAVVVKELVWVEVQKESDET